MWLYLQQPQRRTYKIKQKIQGAKYSQDLKLHEFVIFCDYCNIFLSKVYTHPNRLFYIKLKIQIKIADFYNRNLKELQECGI